MEKFHIEGGISLHGEVVPGGNKNSALPLLAACLLTEEPVILHNVPAIQDVHWMRELLQSLGVTIVETNKNSLTIQAKEITPANLDPDICRRIRASILLAGPMTARSGELILPPPGGDVIGRRRVDTHLLALRKLGAKIEYDRNFSFHAKKIKGGGYFIG